MPAESTRPSPSRIVFTTPNKSRSSSRNPSGAMRMHSYPNHTVKAIHTRRTSTLRGSSSRTGRGRTAPQVPDQVRAQVLGRPDRGLPNRRLRNARPRYVHPGPGTWLSAVSVPRPPRQSRSDEPRLGRQPIPLATARPCKCPSVSTLCHFSEASTSLRSAGATARSSMIMCSCSPAPVSSRMGHMPQVLLGPTKAF